MAISSTLTMVYGNMTTQELATLLGYDRRQLERRAQHGEIPCQIVGGQFRFNRAQIHAWLAQSISGMNRKRLAEVDAGIRSQRQIDQSTPLIAPLLRSDAVVTDLDARTKSSVLRKLVAQAEQTGLVYDRDTLLESVLLREKQGSTALPNGIAIPHPHHPLPYEIADSILVVARTWQEIAYGAPDGGMTDLFFFTASQDAHHHLHMLARLCRLLQDKQLISDLRQADTPDDVMTILAEREAQLLD